MNARHASIAVLPFVNVSGDPEQSYLSDGITEDITVNLSKISALFVISRDMAYAQRSADANAAETAIALGVQYLLQGTVKKVDDHVRISAELVEGHTSRLVWSGRYDRWFEEIFEVQDEISHGIVHALRIKMLPKERDTLGQRLTHNSEAYRFYLMGRSYFHRGHTRRFLRLANQMQLHHHCPIK